MKYLILSLKISALMNSEEDIGLSQKRKVNGLFWSVEVVLLISAALIIIDGYLIGYFYDSTYSTTINDFGNAGFLLGALVSVVIVVDAFRRL